MALEVFTRGQDEDGTPLRVERIPQQEPRCCWCPKVPRGTEPVPENAVELNAMNWRAYQHYLECKAVGQFPGDDPIVRRNAMLIRGVEEAAARMETALANGGMVREAIRSVVSQKK